MKNFLFGFLFLLLFESCVNKTDAFNKQESSQKELKSYTTKVSPRTQLLLDAYKKELKASKKEPNAFKPSENLVQKYSLVELNDNVVYVKGMATFGKDFNRELLSDLAIKVGSKLANQTLLHIPLQNLEAFLQTPNIAYFEIAEKAQLKNQ